MLGSWEIVFDRSKPNSRTSEVLSGDNFDRYAAQLPSGWIEVFDLDLGHFYINLGVCLSFRHSTAAGADAARVFRHTFVPAHSVVGAYEFDYDLTVRLKEESLVDVIAFVDQPLVNRLRVGMKELASERS